jgi:two-component sensor histidine kinase
MRSGLELDESMADGISTEERDAAVSLTMAVVAASYAPLLLLDENLDIVAASGSFCRAFDIDPGRVEGVSVFALGRGEWDVPQLRALLTDTAAGGGPTEAYEFDLKRPGAEPRRLSVNAQRLAYVDLENVRILVAVADITDDLANDKARELARRENELLLKEVSHRVANSLTLVASVLLQGARRTQSKAARSDLRDAHDRVMSVAAVERQLSSMSGEDVPIQSYLTNLCGNIAVSMISEPGQIVIHVSSDDVLVPARRAVSLGLIATELVINALKHAFPQGRGGKVAVAYTERGGAWSLDVSDDGVGMTAVPADAVAGLGTSIVQALARQLEATVEVRNAALGVTVAVTHESV